MSVSPYTIHLKQESNIVAAVPSDCDFLYDFQPSLGYSCDGFGQQVHDNSSSHLMIPSPSAAINIPSPASSYHSMPYASSSGSTMMDPMSLSFSPSYQGVSPLSTSDDSFCFSPFSAQTDALSECQDEQAWLAASSFQPDFTLDGLLNTTPSPRTTPSSPWIGTPSEPRQQTQQQQVLANEGSLLFAPPPPQSVAPHAPAYDAYELSPPNVFVQEPHADQPQPIHYGYPQQYEQNEQQGQQQQQLAVARRRRATTTSSKIHRCPHCKHTSNRANNMKEHILTHDPHREKKFACNLCGKRFARKHDMKRHARSPHTSLTSAL